MRVCVREREMNGRVEGKKHSQQQTNKNRTSLKVMSINGNLNNSQAAQVLLDFEEQWKIKAV